MKSFLPIALFWPLIAIAGCTSRQVYDSLEGARQHECNKVADIGARQRCLDEAGKSYDQYERERAQ